MSILTYAELKKRLKKDLIITPLLEPDKQIGPGSIDLRLGTKFIIMKETEFTQLYPPEITEYKIRQYQYKIYKKIGEDIILHPGHLVLGCTLEYICLPEDLCAYVLTRSRWGRVGLIIATAIYVHPYWKGCLTLEMFNYGRTPLKIPCGTSIAQLVIQKVKEKSFPPTLKTKLSMFPTGPVFVNLKEETDWQKLEQIKEV